MAWINSHPHNDLTSWFAYGSVLRLLRLSGYVDAGFWQKQFDFWVTQFTDCPSHFSLICRCIMQAIRALGSTNSLNSIHLGSLFGHGLRAQNFPVHEVYAALEEISKDISGKNGLISLTDREHRYDSVVRVAEDAGAVDAMPKVTTPENFAQKNKTLRSWRVHCLSLPALAVVANTDTTTTQRRKLKVSRYADLEMA